MINILLDENLSFKIKKELKHLFDDLKHISDLNLINTDDYTIWDYAKTHHYSIVTFDADFIDLSLLNEFPPKIIWLRVGNSSTVNVVQLLKNNYVAINEFLLNQTNLDFERIWRNYFWLYQSEIFQRSCSLRLKILMTIQAKRNRQKLQNLSLFGIGTENGFLEIY